MNFNLSVVIRRLPPTITESDLLHQLSPLPPYEYFYVATTDYSLSPWCYGRAYFKFRQIDDVITFRERFDGYVFVDGSGAEYPVLVEIAPSQKVPGTGFDQADSDPKCATIEQSADYKKFIEDLENENEVTIPSVEQRLKDLEDMRKEKKELGSKPTLLIEYLMEQREERLQKRKEKLRMKDEERRKRIEEKKRNEEREERRREREDRRKKEEKEGRKKREGEKDDRKEDREKEREKGYRSSPRREKEGESHPPRHSDRREKREPKQIEYEQSQYKKEAPRFKREDERLAKKEFRKTPANKQDYEKTYASRGQNRSEEKRRENPNPKSTRDDDRPRTIRPPREDRETSQREYKPRNDRERDRPPRMEKPKPKEKAENCEGVEKKKPAKPSMQIYQPGAARRRQKDEMEKKPDEPK